MARGGIYDQLGGGFARYAVDAAWIVPHFEKMLYDNALLARAYLHGWQVSGDDPLLRQVCSETLDWALRELRGPEGGFASALDADSEGVEGKFYVWTPDELRAALGDDALPTSPSRTGASRPAATSRAEVDPRARRLRRRSARAAGDRAAPDGRARRSACGPGSTTSASRRGTR